ncbi:hypothetical protein [Shimia sp.]|uniref:hypothetical protein n=1 Tax=Shimia sp. TaxID=1954381 RepID=UPI003BAA72F2
MVDANSPIGLHDHLLFNAINLMMVEMFDDQSWEEQAFFMIEEALDDASADHPHVKPLIEAAGKLQYARNFQGSSEERSAERSHARFYACRALTDFSKWRAGLAQAQIRRKFEVIQGDVG